LQIFHLLERRLIKEHLLDDKVAFWKWISPNTIAVVGELAVYHWSLEGSLPPQKIFERQAALGDTQIINYRVDFAQKWLVLIGIKQQDGRIVGAMQLYSVDRGISQVLDGHAAAFARVPVPGNPRPANLFSFVSRTATSAKVQQANRTLSLSLTHSLTRSIFGDGSSMCSKSEVRQTPSSRRRLSSSSSRVRLLATSRS